MSMEIKNSSGRKVSILQDTEATPATSPSYTESGSSSACSSPPPMLSRSNSADSSVIHTPLTPHFPRPLYAPAEHQYGAPMEQTYEKQPYPYYHPVVHAGFAYFPAQLPVEPRTLAASALPKPKKNSYPCPMAEVYNCSDHFTTSGHAARHAKKHTGKKDAFCPECNKAFTRKDNMEQHRRTHSSGRGKSNTENGVKKIKQQPKRPRLSPIQPTGSIPLAMDSSFRTSPAGSPFEPPHLYSSGYSENTYPVTHNFRNSFTRTTGSEYAGLEALAAIAHEQHPIEQRPVERRSVAV